MVTSTFDSPMELSLRSSDSRVRHAETAGTPHEYQSVSSGVALQILHFAGKVLIEPLTSTIAARGSVTARVTSNRACK